MRASLPAEFEVVLIFVEQADQERRRRLIVRTAV
jgi:hypothetical protein